MSISFPGPPELGRSVVIKSGSQVPPGWADAERLTIDAGIYDDLPRLAEVQRRYVRRIPTIFELAGSLESLSRPESTEADPVDLGSDFTFLSELLTKALWHNSYDATNGEPIWWWTRKAGSWIGAATEGPADIVLADGTPAWLDGGPREPLDLEYSIVHHETLELGRSTVAPPPVAPTSDLAPDQMAAVSHQAGPARVIAPAGSGKTRVLTSRLLHLIEDRGLEPKIVTAVAYNKRAATEMKQRLPLHLHSRVRTIHSLGWAILRMAQPQLSLIDEREQRRRLEPITSAPPRANTDVIGPYLEALTEVRIGLRTPADVEAGRDDTPGFTDTFAKYQAILADRGEADHDQQIYGAIRALLADPELRQHWQRECRHLLVDEFQDLTPAYLLLLRLVSSPGLNVFGVGDDDQVIYGYAGADPRFLLEYETLFPGAASYALETNYRCPRDVVNGASTLLGYNERRLEKNIRADSTSDGLSVERAIGTDLGKVALDRIKRLIDDGVGTEQIAVLTRVNSSLLPVQVALAEHGIPFQSMLSSSVLDRTLLRATLAWIRLALDIESMTRNDLFEAIRRPGRGLTRLFTESIDRRRGPFGIDEIEDLGSQLDSKRKARWDIFTGDLRLAASPVDSTTQLLDVLADDIGLSRAANALDAGRTQADRSGQSDDLVALQRIAGLHDAPASFEPWLRERLATPSVPTGVTLSTVHRVKGLEWDHVIVFGADSSLMPHHLSSEIEEERRIFHVAMTRGIETVTVIADRENPSVFLSELDGTRPKSEAIAAAKTSEKAAVLTGVRAAVGDQIRLGGGYEGEVVDATDAGYQVRLKAGGAELTARWGDRVEVDGRAGPLVRSPDSVDENLLDRLKRWRLEQSNTQEVPAFVIFHDTTLNEIAAMRPTTPEGLLAVTGIGPAKLEAYGDDLLGILSDLD